MPLDRHPHRPGKRNDVPIMIIAVGSQAASANADDV
jgi:hypothetical protein